MFQLWWGHKTRLQPGCIEPRCTGAKLWETERFYVEKAWGKVEQNMENIVVGICFTTYTSISTFLIFFEDPNGILFNNGCYVAFNHQMAISTGYCSNEGWMWYIQHPRPFFGVWFFVSEPRLVNHWVNIDHMCHGHYFEYMPGYAYPPLIQVCFPCVRNPLW